MKFPSFNNNDNISERLNRKEIKDSFLPKTIDNPDTGESIKCKIGLCPFCYDGTDEKKQFVIIDKNNYYCFSCYRYKVTSKFFKSWVKNNIKYMQKLDKYPGEMIPELIKEMEEEPSTNEQLTNIRTMISDPDPKITEIVNDVRNTNTYKSYPQEVSDENRLILSLFRILYASSWGEFVKSNPNASTDELDDEFHAFIKSGNI